MSLREQLLILHERSKGALTPELVVDTARDPEHPLHSRFEWNDTIAGEKYRREQARHLIKSVKIPIERGEDEPPSELRAFLPVYSSEGCTFQPTEEIAEDPFTRKLVLDTMRREIKQLHDRYAQYEEFFYELRKVVNG